MRKTLTTKQKPPLQGIFTSIILIALFSLSSFSAKAIDPPYQQDMERLTRVLGSLYFLQPLCKFNQIDWRKEANELILLDKPNNDRKQRLIGAFNQGYIDYAQSYRSCTKSANFARQQLLLEAQTSSIQIHTKFAE